MEKLVEANSRNYKTENFFKEENLNFLLVT